MRKFRKCVSCGGALKGADQSFTFTCTSCVQKLPKYTTQQRAEAIDSKVEEMRAESHDAVVAEMRRGSGTETGWIGIDTARNWAGRVQSAHARELAEQQAAHAAEVGHERWLRDIAESVTEATRDQRDNAVARADAAMGLVPRLRVVVQYCPSAERTTLNTLLGELQQALAGGERKDG